MKPLRLLLSCWLPILVISCAREHQAPPPEEKTAIAAAPLNPAPTVHDFAVYASNSVELNQQAVVAGGDVGAKNASARPFLVQRKRSMLVPSGIRKKPIGFGLM